MGGIKSQIKLTSSALKRNLQAHILHAAHHTRQPVTQKGTIACPRVSKRHCFKHHTFYHCFFALFPKHPLSIVTWTPTKPPVLKDFHIWPLSGTYFVPKITVSTTLLAPLSRNLQFLQSQTHLPQPKNACFQTPQFLSQLMVSAETISFYTKW